MIRSLRAPTSAARVPAWLAGTGAFVWFAVAVAAFLALTSYSQRPGAAAAPPPAPDDLIALAGHEYLLAIAVHPKCPCTRATVYELERLATRCGDAVRYVALVYAPANGDEAWETANPFDLTTRIPGIAIQPDPGGHGAARLGCRTSGAIVLYDASGTPRFWGGITAGRGHAGDNAGSEAIAAIVGGITPPVVSTPVYGCAITGPCMTAGPRCCEELRDE